MTALLGLVGRAGTEADGPLAAMARTVGAPTRLTFGPVGLAHDGRASAVTRSSMTVMADGHVDDRRSVAPALGLGLEQVRAMSAAELLLEMYERWGERLADRLCGEVTFAVWDGRRGVLSLATSAPVAPPLYYTTGGEQLAFAGRPRTLFALPHLRRRIDQERVARFLTHVDTGLRRSYWAGIARLLPGEWLTARHGQHQVRRWWSPELRPAEHRGEPGASVEPFQELLGEVVSDHVASAGRVGVFLSGGLDSGAVAAVAAQSLAREGRRLATYTEVPRDASGLQLPPDRYADERPYVEALARMYPNIAPAFVTAPGSGIMDGLDEVFESAEVPVRNASNRAWMEEIYRRCSADGMTTMLNGDQGNLTVSWSGPALLAELVGARRYRAAWHEARAMSRTGASRASWRALLRQGVLPLLPEPVTLAVDAALGRPVPLGANPYAGTSLVAPELVRRLRLPERDENRYRRYMGFRGDVAQRRLRVLRFTAADAGELDSGYRRRFGVATRVPLADRRLVEFCLALPESHAAGNGERRLLIRRGMEGRLPPEILSARTRGLQGADWFERASSDRARFLAAVEDFAGDEDIGQVLDIPRMRRLLADWPGQGAADPRVVRLYRGVLPVGIMAGMFIRWARAA